MGAENQPQKDDHLQSGGRKDNAAQPVNDAPDNAGAERYPPTNKDDSVDKAAEARTFDPGATESAEPAPTRENDPTINQAGLRSDEEPAEGKR